MATCWTRIFCEFDLPAEATEYLHQLLSAYDAVACGEEEEVLQEAFNQEVVKEARALVTEFENPTSMVFSCGQEHEGKGRKTLSVREDESAFVEPFVAVVRHVLVKFDLPDVIEIGFAREDTRGSFNPDNVVVSRQFEHWGLGTLVSSLTAQLEAERSKSGEGGEQDPSAPLPEKELKSGPYPPVPAVAETSDGTVKAEFDAAPWLMHAPDDCIRALAECGWGNDYVADDVLLEYPAGYLDSARLSIFRKYLDVQGDLLDANLLVGPLPGFDCRVNETSAMEWLKEHKPDLASSLRGSLPVHSSPLSASPC